MPEVSIAQWHAPIKVGRLRILEAALDAGVPYPHGCGTGECGGCKSELLSGHVVHDRHSPDALSEAERQSGLILACRARPVDDVQVRWLSQAAPLPMVKLDTRVASVQRVAHDVVALTLSLPIGAKFEFRPGQFAKLRFGRKLPVRSYSMASQPGQSELVFHVRVVPDGLVSPYVAKELAAGEKVELRGPFGDASWQRADDDVAGGRILLVGGGTGMAPILSILDAMLREGVVPGRMHVMHGVRAERDLYVLEQLQQRQRQHGFRLSTVLSVEPAPGHRFGTPHEVLAQDHPDLRGARVYVAGPPPMVKAVSELVLSRGVRQRRLFADAFTAAEPEKRSLWERVTGWGGLD